MKLTTKKAKIHDAMDDMFNFSHALEKYPILYDDKVRNKHFSEDFRGMGEYIQKCYAELGAQVGLSPEETQKKHTKYVDAVTKALGQLKRDLQDGT